ncbi:uncharacterized protein BDZ83DRAFT_597817 [Colletotrichum acutatum]|uniref:Uncharacterized protein n=1 Tax=Glomerella acutata TaxID=27357 RepID=A0AAD8XQE7_GLOAC|nr:uncharacterized protein BDZ83DRAFT_597817 [Colletotrichum acutatum]KAK1731532.1 hypothetical protein BDZ83DRAFT_597817 [Colletotrichum acutatum]
MGCRLSLVLPVCPSVFLGGRIVQSRRAARVCYCLCVCACRVRVNWKCVCKNRAGRRCLVLCSCAWCVSGKVRTGSTSATYVDVCQR